MFSTTKIIALLGALILAGSITWWLTAGIARLQPYERQVSIQLARGTTPVLELPAKRGHAEAVVLFLSGDGGWSSLEEAMARGLRGGGYEVVGVDSVAYAATDYNLATLQSDFTTLARRAEAPYAAHPLPLIVGGYSMGAAQAIAIAGGPRPPPALVGILLVDPRSRGRYGLRTSDQWNVLPTGPNTFAVEDFAATIKNMRVVQWHAGNDTIDSRSWLDALTVPHKEFDFPGDGHSYHRLRDVFVREFVESVGWILHPMFLGNNGPNKRRG